MNNFSAHNSNSYSGIYLFNQTQAPLPVSEKDIRKIITALKEHDTVEIELAEVVFVDETEILRINNEYLEHDYITDVITFPYDDNKSGKIEGTLYCCASQIEKQAKENKQSIREEFLRIIIHGLLHLSNYDDKKSIDKALMTRRENFYLERCFNL